MVMEIEDPDRLPVEEERHTAADFAGDDTHGYFLKNVSGER
jgi:hypothetical protein